MSAHHEMIEHSFARWTIGAGFGAATLFAGAPAIAQEVRISTRDCASEVHLVARDMQHLKDLVLDNFTNRPAVTRVETSIIYEARVRHELPQLLESLASSS